MNLNLSSWAECGASLSKQGAALTAGRGLCSLAPFLGQEEEVNVLKEAATVAAATEKKKRKASCK